MKRVCLIDLAVIYLKIRMMIPLMDVSGGIVGFTGRIIEDDPNAPKYLNTPQTLLYDK